METAGSHVAYLRVSTERQGRSGLGLEAQRAAILTYLNGGQWKLQAEFVEIESGKRDDNRPALQAALRMAKLTGSTLVIAKLDRLSRDAAFLLKLQAEGVKFLAADMPAANQLTVGIMALVAQEERAAISARTKAALKAAQARGVKLGGWKGGPKVNPALGTAARVRKADVFASSIFPLIEEAEARGLSLRGVAAELEERGIKTARGGTAWSAAAVRAIKLRAI